MKRMITLFLALIMVLSLTACASKNDAPPQSGGSESATLPTNGGGTAINPPLEGATGEGIPATELLSSIPAKFPIYQEYVFPYMGFSYVLPQEIRDMLKSGEAWMCKDVQWKDEKNFDYAMMVFRLAEKNNFAKDEFPSLEEYEKWFSTTKLFGAITIVKSEYLKNNTIESITFCDANEEIGKSSDGKYVFYFSTNKAGDVTELFRRTKVTISNPEKFSQNGYYQILDGPHK